MIFYKSKDFTIGTKIEINGDPYLILENIFMNPGRGQAFNKLKLKNVLNNSVITKTVKIGEKFKKADVEIKDLIYLYRNENIFYFYDEKNIEYYELNFNMVEKLQKWLKEGILYSATLWNNKIIELLPPKFIDLQVLTTEIFDKKSCASKNSKFAKLETGMDIKVPSFIKENDIIKIDTEKESYIARTSDL